MYTEHTFKFVSVCRDKQIYRCSELILQRWGRPCLLNFVNGSLIFVSPEEA